MTDLKHVGEKAWGFCTTPKKQDWFSCIRDNKHCIIDKQGLQTTNEQIQRESENQPRYLSKIDCI